MLVFQLKKQILYVTFTIFLWIFQITNSATTIQIRPVELFKKIIFHNWADLIVQLSPMIIINK